MVSEARLVSVVVPVYNVEIYLERCIRSIVEQSYTNLEIIIVNDGSTDNSLRIALRWKDKDPRIIVLDQENRGLGPTRTRGAFAAKGEYLAFVDSDDYLHPDFVKHMVEKAVSTDSQVVYCDVKKVWDDNDDIRVMRFPLLAEEGRRVSEFPQLLNQSGLWTWNKLYRRELWERLKIEQPANAVEDICTIFVLLVKGERIAQVSETLYFYTQRGDSLSYADSYPQAYINALDMAQQNYIRYGIERKFWFYIGKNFGESLTFVKLYFNGRLELTEKIQEMEKRFQEMFLSEKKENALVFGSFSLRSMVGEAFYSIPVYYGFSSLIAAVNPPKEPGKIPGHNNPFRADALRKEFLGQFKQELIQKAGQMDYIFFDFIEERYGVVELANGGYATNSEAYREAEGALTETQPVASFSSGQFARLWKQSCETLKKLLEHSGFKGKIVLVRNRLADEYGKKNQRSRFEDWERIREANQIIQGLEEQFLDILEPVAVFDFTHREDYYTAADFAHGCDPWHLNVDIYSGAGAEILRFMNKKEAGF